MNKEGRREIDFSIQNAQFLGILLRTLIPGAPRGDFCIKKVIPGGISRGMSFNRVKRKKENLGMHMSQVHFSQVVPKDHITALVSDCQTLFHNSLPGRR